MFKTPKEFRELVRMGQWTSQTAGLLSGFVQANLVVLPQEYAVDFASFCVKNPKPCPILDISSPGRYDTFLAQDADLRTDLPKYNIYRKGCLEKTVTDLIGEWRDDLVCFLLGCSHTFEHILVSAGVPLRYLEQGLSLSLYNTNIETIPVGPFHGTVIVSMRPIPQNKVAKATVLSARYPKVHGAPLHIGNPSLIGVDLDHPYVGDAIELVSNDIPVFWGCGVTPQHIALNAKIPYMITHSPGHMFITDATINDLED